MTSQPEIAHRCPSCGVSLRERASFCPQCGKQLPATTAGSATGQAGEVVRRVEKHISTVFDEAAYDPSLRFVLVAAALFILFLVILILSELIN